MTRPTHAELSSIDADFRLSLLRGDIEEAASAAAQLIPELSAEEADVLLQTLVQRGWFDAVLPLYRSAYDAMPGSELLRRRLIGLCIRNGDIEEAKQLARLGPLQIAA